MEACLHGDELTCLPETKGCRLSDCRSEGSEGGQPGGGSSQGRCCQPQKSDGTRACSKAGLRVSGFIFGRNAGVGEEARAQEDGRPAGLPAGKPGSADFWGFLSWHTAPPSLTPQALFLGGNIEVSRALLWGHCRGHHTQAPPSASSSTAARPQRPTLWGCTHSHTCTLLHAHSHNSHAHTRMRLTPLHSHAHIPTPHHVVSAYLQGMYLAAHAGWVPLCQSEPGPRSPGVCSITSLIGR